MREHPERKGKKKGVYKCFQFMKMRSEVAYATSRTAVTCITPAWGEVYPATSAAIELWSDNQTVDAGLDYDIEYDFYPVVEEILQHPNPTEMGGRAVGNETVYLRGYGFNPDNGVDCHFEALDFGWLMTTYDNPALDTTVVACKTPNWGSKFGAVPTTIELDTSNILTRQKSRCVLIHFINFMLKQTVFY